MNVLAAVLTPCFFPSAVALSAALHRYRLKKGQAQAPGAGYEAKGFMTPASDIIESWSSPNPNLNAKEAYPSLPIAGQFASRALPDAVTIPARRVVCFLGHFACTISLLSPLFALSSRG